MNRSDPRLIALASLLLGACQPGANDAPDTDVVRGVYSVPQHPFLAGNGTSNIHADGYMTDAYAWAGPSDLETLQVTPATLDGECASVTFDGRGRLITVCISVTGGKRLVALDPHTLEPLARLDLPPGAAGTNFSGGGYFVLDATGRAIVPTSDQHLWTVSLDAAGTTFTLDSDVDLTHPASGDALTAEDGGVESVLPDWSGRLWLVTEAGAVGHVDPGTGRLRLVRLDGEAIGNSFAVDDTGGVFVVSEHALYRFDVADDGSIVTTWREPYDRGTRLKAGQVNFGSGTTPTLLDDDLIAITDNAEPRMNVLVYDRRAAVDGARKLCELPVFEEDASATDNSLIGFDRSFVVENNAGYGALTSVAGEGVTSPGMTRVQVDAEGCHAAWTTAVAAPSVVAKFSYASWRIYTYEKRTDGWYLVALDADSGAEAGRKRVGTGFDSNNHWAPITLGEDGTVYIGTVVGLTALRAP